VRKFTDKEIDADDLKVILRAALMSPTGKSVRGWHFIVVDDKDMLQRFSEGRAMGSQFLAGAKVAVVVLGDQELSDVWTEDASIAAVTMQYQAADLGIGSCWCQVRGRFTKDGEATDSYLRALLGYPANLVAECIVGFGYADVERKPQNEDGLKWENVHIDKYRHD
jgi:nitroreductase